MKGNLWASLRSQIWGTTGKSEFVVGGFEQDFYFPKCENGIISCKKISLYFRLNNPRIEGKPSYL